MQYFLHINVMIVTKVRINIVEIEKARFIFVHFIL